MKQWGTGDAVHTGHVSEGILELSMRHCKLLFTLWLIKFTYDHVITLLLTRRCYFKWKAIAQQEYSIKHKTIPTVNGWLRIFTSIFTIQTNEYRVLFPSIFSQESTSFPEHDQFPEPNLVNFLRIGLTIAIIVLPPVNEVSLNVIKLNTN